MRFVFGTLRIGLVFVFDSFVLGLPQVMNSPFFEGFVVVIITVGSLGSNGSGSEYFYYFFLILLHSILFYSVCFVSFFHAFLFFTVLLLFCFISLFCLRPKPVNPHSFLSSLSSVQFDIKMMYVL